MNRPVIPADMKRRVLVETGHRWAIPHCGSTEIDLHHIIPWEQCQEHAPDNLIALCPNCHRRADRGDIDRKSLILYKLRGQHILQGEPGQILDYLEPWRSRNFSEHRNDTLKYEIEAEYPYFRPNEHGWSEEVNSYIQATVLYEAQGIRNIANEAPWTWDKVSPNEGMSSFVASYEVIFFHHRLLSIRFSFFAYHFGANHPNHWTRTLNLFLDPVYRIYLKHFFDSDEGYLKQISGAVRAKLELNEYADHEALFKGTEPEHDNFSTFNFSPSGFLFTFDEYSIGPYSLGRQEVWVAFSELSGLVLPNELTSGSRRI